MNFYDPDSTCIVIYGIDQDLPCPISEIQY